MLRREQASVQVFNALNVACDIFTMPYDRIVPDSVGLEEESQENVQTHRLRLMSPTTLQPACLQTPCKADDITETEQQWKEAICSRLFSARRRIDGGSQNLHKIGLLLDQFRNACETSWNPFRTRKLRMELLMALVAEGRGVDQEQLRRSLSRR